MIMLIPFLLDYLVGGDSQIGRYLQNINIYFLGDFFTKNMILLFSWGSYILLLSYIFRVFKNLKIEGFKMLLLVVYNIFIQIDIKSMRKSYYFWIVSIIVIFILEIFAERYAPENRDIIDITPEEEKGKNR
ncbi:MAG: hypothetical protein ACRCZ9_00965 [Fusobacteriaceae bacterium]